MSKPVVGKRYKTNDNVTRSYRNREFVIVDLSLILAFVQFDGESELRSIALSGWDSCTVDIVESETWDGNILKFKFV